MLTNTYKCLCARTPHAVSARPAGRSRKPQTCTAASRSGASTLVKICGVTNPGDAQTAVEAGADFVGMIMWPKAKRAVSNDTASQIASVAKAQGAQPVGVFVDEDAESILGRCLQCGIQVAQLHGDGARAGVSALQAAGLQVIYVQHVTPEGLVQTPKPASPVEWVLLDGLQGGSGVALDWSRLESPEHASKGWLLAGGLNPDNVQQALSRCRPTAVDVSSGVCGPDGLGKDSTKIQAFVKNVVHTPRGQDS